MAPRCALAGVTGLLFVTFGAGLSSVGISRADNKEQAASAGPANTNAQVSIARARESAKLMHNIYAATLDVMHHHFFRRDRSVLPARALEDVFAQMEDQSKVKAKWIAVNTKAMSINHEPKSAFEKKAAAAIAAGNGEFELVEDGYYRRAAAIPLGSGCVSCHTGFFAKTPKSPRVAGLIISVPLNKNKSSQ